MKLYKQILLSSILISILVLFGCSNIDSSNDVVEDGLITNSISFGLGGDPDNTLVTYNFNLWNRTKKPILIKSVEPILSEDLLKRLEDQKKIINEVNKTISSNTAEIITGTFNLKTPGLGKQEVENLNIQIKSFRIITEQVIGID